MKSAPGAGIVSSVVLESNDLDEIDMEWLGAQPDEMQSNYFGKGQTTTYNRGQFHAVQGTQSDWITYTVDWTADRIIWMAGGTVLRTLTAQDAETDQYPQTPMQVKFGAWAGGDPSDNAPGTVKWAEGPVDWTKGPFTMEVQSMTVSDYSTGKEYIYTNHSGDWQSIEAVDGKIMGNYNRDDALTATATAAGAGSGTTSDVSVPIGGMAHASSASVTETGWPWVATASGSSQAADSSVPAGWTMTADGKIEKTTTSAAAAAMARASCNSLALLLSISAGAAVFAARTFL